MKDIVKQYVLPLDPAGMTPEFVSRHSLKVLTQILSP